MLMSIPSNPLNPRCNAIASHTFYPVIQTWVVFWITCHILYKASVMKSSSAWAYHFPQFNFCTKSALTNWTYFFIFIWMVCIWIIIIMSIPSSPLNHHCNAIASHTFYLVIQKWVVFWIASCILYEASVMKSSSAWAYHFPQFNFCTKSVLTNWTYFFIFIW